MSELERLKNRLQNYPGAHEGESWKRETDLTKCTPREKAALRQYGLTVEDMMQPGFNRGEVAHMLFGYRYAAGR